MVVDTIGSDGIKMVSPGLFPGRRLRARFQFRLDCQPDGSAQGAQTPAGTGARTGDPGVGCLFGSRLVSTPPPNYQAVAKVLVRSTTPQIMWKTVDAEAERDESIRSQKSQILQLKSRFVINNALQQKGISDLKMIRELERKQLKPDEWLTENLQAQFLAGTEVLQISLDGKDPRNWLAWSTPS